MSSHGRVRKVAAPVRFGRRRALATSSAGVAAFLIACGGDKQNGGDAGGGTAGSGAPATQTAEELPAAGGIISQPIATDPVSLAPHQSTSYTGVWPAAPCFNQLVQFDPTKPTTSPQDILPDLAEEWEQP